MDIFEEIKKRTYVRMINIGDNFLLSEFIKNKTYPVPSFEMKETIIPEDWLGKEIKE